MAKDRSQRIAEVRNEAKGLQTLTRNAESEDDFAEIARRAGAIQRRSRLLAGLGRGG